MSNREQDIKIAELMGWFKTTHPLLYNDSSDDSFVWVVDEDYTPRTPHKRFLPSANIADAMRVIEWMRVELEFFITITSQMDGYLISVSDFQAIGHYYCHLSSVNVYHFDELADAICHIILETVESK